MTIPILSPPIQSLSRSTQRLDLLRLVFAWRLSPRELPRFRGAIAEAAGRSQDLFHNHEPATGAYLYRYPLIQYRLDRGRASVQGFNAGAEALADWLARWDGQLHWQGTQITPSLAWQQRHRCTLAPSEAPRRYLVHDWLALNQANYQRWQQAAGLGERVALLERILSAHLIALAKALHWEIDWPLQVQVQELQRQRPLYYRGQPRLAFDLAFQVRAQLPPHLGLGKGVSEGLGRLWPV